jgi:hypothetical protein
MMKSIAFLTLLLFITTIGISQETNLLTSPGENTQIENTQWEPLEIQSARNWRESSFGLFFMPIPLNIESIDFDFPSGNGSFDAGENFFSTGFGLSANVDFKSSGSGLGGILYYAFINNAEGSDLSATDIFMALKYDFALGLSAFEISPLAGLGLLTFQDDASDSVLGNSLYFSAGARVTWLAANRLFLGADIQLSPIIFNPKSLLGVEDIEVNTGQGFETATDVSINYALPFQVNISLRYNLSK